MQLIAIFFCFSNIYCKETVVNNGAGIFAVHQPSGGICSISGRMQPQHQQSGRTFYEVRQPLTDIENI